MIGYLVEATQYNKCSTDLIICLIITNANYLFDYFIYYIQVINPN